MGLQTKKRLELEVFSSDMRKELLCSAQEAWASYLKAGIKVLPCKECSHIIARHRKNFQQEASIAPENGMEIDLGLLKIPLATITL